MGTTGICSRTNLNDLLNFLSCFARNFNDDTTAACGKNVDFFLIKSEEHPIVAIELFENNYMKNNSAKSRLFVSGEQT